MDIQKDRQLDIQIDRQLDGWISNQIFYTDVKLQIAINSNKLENCAALPTVE